MSKLVIALLAAAAMLIVGLAYGGYRLYVYVEHEPAFCGSCHIMEAARKT
jgi:nitrate/TMAO reductase-like tetraheme cytochrome c subunit